MITINKMMNNGDTDGENYYCNNLTIALNNKWSYGFSKSLP